MAEDKKTLKSIHDAILAAESSIRTARQLLSEVLWEEAKDSATFSTNGLEKYQEEDLLIVEWVFTGESMLWADGNTYPIPQNYASKSLLVQGSRLKGIIQPNGKITYKIIEEIPYESIIGIITKNGDRYQIATDMKTYNVLMAAITFHRCEVGDTVSIRIPRWKNATYAVIENIVPKS